jgi:hypothetical protein
MRIFLLFLASFSHSQEIIIHTNYSLFDSVTLSGFQTGHGIEDVNHELIGGCSVQMVFGEGFEEPRGIVDVSGSTGGPARTTWWPINEQVGSCEFSIETGEAFTGLQSQAIQVFPPFDTICAIDNLGLDSEGMYFGNGEIFDFSIWAKLLTGGNEAHFNISLIDTLTGSTLASGIIPLSSSDWMRYNLSLTSTGPNTPCVFNDSSPLVECFSNAEGLCPSCSGALRIAIGSSSSSSSLTGETVTVLIDQVYLSAESGNTRGPSPGAPATRADVSSLISEMGLTALRLGGSAILVDEYRWKRFRGPAELRQPYSGFWYKYGSSSSWGIFEFLNLCESLNISLCVVTLNAQESLEDVGDFLEYVYGNATTTVWGAQRAADGFINPFMPFAIEIGNENDHTDVEYISLVSAFAQTLRLTSLRLELPFIIQVCIGVTPGTWPPESILPLVAAVSNTSDALDLMIDFHIGGDNPASDPETALVFISSVRSALLNASFNYSIVRGAVLEENGGRHDLQRGLGHARNSHRLHCIGDFVRIETAANGFQVLGRNDNSWDQGALFITQNSTYLSPHGMVNIVLSSMNEAGAAMVPVEATLPSPFLDVIALVRADGNAIKISAVNIASTEIASNITLNGCTTSSGSMMNIVLVAGDSLTQQNLPGQPLSIFPVYSSVPVPVGNEPRFPIVFSPYSVTSLLVECAVGRKADALPLWSGGVATTCDIPSFGPQNLSFAGFMWNYFNDGPWQVVDDNLKLYCGATDENCFDEAISVNGPEVSGNGSVSVNVTFASQGASYSGDDDAGLLLRCGLAAVRGMDGFSCYEVSLGANQDENATSGFVLVGSHFLPPPGSFQLLQKVAFDVPAGIPHVLTTQILVYSGKVTLIVSVNGVVALEVSDSAHATDPFGGPHIGLRAFYSTATFSNLVVVSDVDSE